MVGDAERQVDRMVFPDRRGGSVLSAVGWVQAPVRCDAAGGAGRALKPSSAPSGPPAGIECKSRGAQPRYLARHLHGPYGRCRPSYFFFKQKTAYEIGQ